MRCGFVKSLKRYNGKSGERPLRRSGELSFLEHCDEAPQCGLEGVCAPPSTNCALVNWPVICYKGAIVFRLLAVSVLTLLAHSFGLLEGCLGQPLVLTADKLVGMQLFVQRR